MIGTRRSNLLPTHSPDRAASSPPAAFVLRDVARAGVRPADVVAVPPGDCRRRPSVDPKPES